MQLNPDQENAVKIIHGFLGSTSEQFMCISGPAGVGKTFVVKHVVNSLDEYHKTRKLLGLKGQTRLKLAFTATTNKAAEALADSLGHDYETKTIHSFLGLSLNLNTQTGKDELVDTRLGEMIPYTLIFVDEASYVDEELMNFIKGKLGTGSKVIFMGDAAQCKNAGSTIMPAFDSGFRTAELNQIMRQEDGNPIKDLSLKLREAVFSNGPIPPCNIDGKYIIWMPRPQFDRALLADMQNELWTYNTSKFLAWRNKRIQQYNKGLNEHIRGTREFQPGDYAVNNHYVKGTKALGGGIGTDRMVHIDSLKRGVVPSQGIPGTSIWVDGREHPFFMPDNHTDIAKVINKLRKSLTGNFSEDRAIHSSIETVNNTWVDFRPVYAQTVYKAQGSTFKRVFIDLTDIGTCRDFDQMLRMLYVAVSRARLQLFLTGDI